MATVLEWLINQANPIPWRQGTWEGGQQHNQSRREKRGGVAPAPVLPEVLQPHALRDPPSSATAPIVAFPVKLHRSAVTWLPGPACTALPQFPLQLCTALNIYTTTTNATRTLRSTLHHTSLWRQDAVKHIGLLGSKRRERQTLKHACRNTKRESEREREHLERRGPAGFATRPQRCPPRSLCPPTGTARTPAPHPAPCMRPAPRLHLQLRPRRSTCCCRARLWSGAPQ